MSETMDDIKREDDRRKACFDRMRELLKARQECPTEDVDDDELDDDTDDITVDWP